MRVLCTLGPTSLYGSTIHRLAETGVDLFRINLSHAPVGEIESIITLIREHSDVPICLDTQGAQVRTGILETGSVKLEYASNIDLSAYPKTGDGTNVPLYPESVLPQLDIDDLLTVDFDAALLQIIEIGSNTRARVISGGVIASNKAVTIIGRSISLPALTKTDNTALEIGLSLGIDAIALSFANSKSDVEHLRTFCGDSVEIIAKIESRLGLQNLDSILDVTDAILIDRGDLSREIPLQSLPFAQKNVIEHANQKGVPVYVATNLLESMVTNIHPTRAEVNDVINTLIDGADGLVLAAETTIGKHPVESVQMVRGLINEFQSRKSGQYKSISYSNWSNLPSPHGDVLVDRIITDWDDVGIQRLPRVRINEQTMMDVRQITSGGYSPLSGFMNLETLDNVLSENRLPDGTVWTMPILFQIKERAKFLYGPGDTVTLNTGSSAEALFHIEELFTYDLKDLANKWFGTSDSAHPGVKSLLDGTEQFVAGNVDLLDSALKHHLPYELIPKQVRSIFTQLGWQKVVGFHTRNVAHRAHEYLQLTALERNRCDGIFIHPVIGTKKSGDFSRSIILKTYEHLIKNFYPERKVVLAGFANYSRYAGPREAIFTAICRRNFGCSHFIVGRDHTGVEGYYPPEASRRLWEDIGDIGIEPIMFEEVYYCEKCASYVDCCQHNQQYSLKISGSIARKTLLSGQPPPNWHMRESLSTIILDELSNGGDVFVP